MKNNDNHLQMAEQADIEKIYGRLKTACHAQGKTTSAYRKVKLKQLRAELVRMRPEWQAALMSDFAKSPQETLLSEVLTVKSELDHAIAHLDDWLRPRHVSTPITLIGTRSMVIPESKGIVLIISPWNFPVLLALGPLISAFAAGNCCLLKPSEHTPATNRALRKLMERVFDPHEVAMIEGGREVTEPLLQLTFDHIFFTGSTAVGKIIMQAAACNLTPVTLELGGKTPVIVDETADINDAAMRTAWGKWFNAGQTCIAPDYVLVHEKVKLAFRDRLTFWTERFYGSSPEENEEYTGIINETHMRRLSAMVNRKPEGQKMAPVIREVNADFALPEEEIFGPVLPIIGYSDLDKAIALINDKPRPLALYLFSESRKNTTMVLENTRSGSVGVNEVLLQFFNPELPFGGIGQSGLGKGHGHSGFLEFSHQKAVIKQTFRFNAVRLILPPFGAFKKKLISFIVRWL